MATNSKLPKDPTEVAMSAIQDALEMRGPEARPALSAQRDTARVPADDDLFIDPLLGRCSRPRAPHQNEQWEDSQERSDSSCHILFSSECCLSASYAWVSA